MSGSPLARSTTASRNGRSITNEVVGGVPDGAVTMAVGADACEPSSSADTNVCWSKSESESASSSVIPGRRAWAGSKRLGTPSAASARGRSSSVENWKTRHLQLERRQPQVVEDLLQRRSVELRLDLREAAPIRHDQHHGQLAAEVRDHHRLPRVALRIEQAGLGGDVHARGVLGAAVEQGEVRLMGAGRVEALIPRCGDLGGGGQHEPGGLADLVGSHEVVDLARRLVADPGVHGRPGRVGVGPEVDQPHARSEPSGQRVEERRLHVRVLLAPQGDRDLDRDVALAHVVLAIATAAVDLLGERVEPRVEVEVRDHVLHLGQLRGGLPRRARADLGQADRHGIGREGEVAVVACELLVEVGGELRVGQDRGGGGRAVDRGAGCGRAHLGAGGCRAAGGDRGRDEQGHRDPPEAQPAPATGDGLGHGHLQHGRGPSRPTRCPSRRTRCSASNLPHMRYVEVNGVRLSAIGVGTWQFGSTEWGYGPDYARKTAGDIIHRALDLGVNLIDTAEIYGMGESERIVGRAIAERRDQVFLATKLFPVLPIPPVVERRAVESAGRLKVTEIDLYQVHWPNPLVPNGAHHAGHAPAAAGRARAPRRGQQLHLLRWRTAERLLGSPGAVEPGAVQPGGAQARPRAGALRPAERSADHRLQPARPGSARRALRPRAPAAARRCAP